MHDLEGHFVELCEKPNPNILIWGSSGQGKTYFCCRRIEEILKVGKRVIIIDFSGSYTKKELMKNKILFLEKIQVLNPYVEKMEWGISSEDEESMISNLSDTLIEILRIESYFQRRLLRKILKVHLKKEKNFSVPCFVKTLEKEYVLAKKKGDWKDNVDNIGRLLTRLSIFEMIENFHVVEKDRMTYFPVTIFQLSDFPEQERRFLSEFMIISLWKEILSGRKKFDVILLDEFQLIPMKSGNTFLRIMREGRKYGLELILSTQFISNYSEDVETSLLQAGNLVIFKPAACDLRFSATIIDERKREQWIGVLERLDVGQAVVKEIGRAHV